MDLVIKPPFIIMHNALHPSWPWKEIPTSTSTQPFWCALIHLQHINTTMPGMVYTVCALCNGWIWYKAFFISLNHWVLSYEGGQFIDSLVSDIPVYRHFMNLGGHLEFLNNAFNFFTLKSLYMACTNQPKHETHYWCKFC